MTSISHLAATTLCSLLAGSTGINQALGASALQYGEDLALLGEDQLSVGHVPAELQERGPTRYPQVHVFCEKVTNTLREKFRGFSGTVRLVVEIRLSQERLEGLERRLEKYTDAVLATLGLHRGDWGNGLAYGGGYEVTFQAVKAGGKNYSQTARVVIEVDGSV